MILNKVFFSLIPKDLLVSCNKEELFKIHYILKSNDITYESFCKYVLDNNFSDKLIVILYKFIVHIVNIYTREIIEELENINPEIKEKITIDIFDLVYINYKNGLVYYDCNKKNYMILMKRFNYIPEEFKTKLLKWFIKELSYTQSLANIS